MIIERLSRSRTLRTASAVLLAFSLAACAADSGGETEAPETPETPETQPVPAEISEAAMDNFVRKLDAGNYVVDADGFLKTTVSSPEQVGFAYYEDMYDDYALFTLNDETFRSFLAGDTLGEAEYLMTGNALSAAGYRLPNYWAEISDGNLFELFYNNPEMPLEFVSYDDNVKMTLMSLAGYGSAALNLMHEVYMVFDAEDPAEVRFTAVVDDNPVARIYFDDLDVTLKFGGAETDPRVDAWLKAPVYPAARTEWDDNDLFFLNSVFLPGYGADALPFPDFASYALTLDEDAFAMNNMILLRDAHGTDADLAHYITLLEDAGFTACEETAEDGGTRTVYRKPLREEYLASVSAYPHMDNGFVLEARTFHDSPEYDSLAAMNDLIRPFGYPDLPESEHLTGWYGVDDGRARTESWLYFFDYVLSLYATAQFDDAAELETYLDDYGVMLEGYGYTPVYMENGEEGKVLDYYESANGASVFRYAVGEDGTVTFQFRNEREFTPEEAITVITDAGIPEVPLRGNISCRDITGYHRMVRDFKGPLYFTLYQPFEDTTEAERFLDDYTSVLEDAGYVRTNPMMIGSLKANAYYNEEEDRFVAFDYFPDNSVPMVAMDFVANK